MVYISLSRDVPGPSISRYRSGSHLSSAVSRPCGCVVIPSRRSGSITFIHLYKRWVIGVGGFALTPFEEEGLQNALSVSRVKALVNFNAIVFILYWLGYCCIIMISENKKKNVRSSEV